jgi:hypothetical protein
MTSNEVMDLKQGDWFVNNDMLMYVAKKNYNGIFYSSHSFLSLPSFVNFIGYDDVYSLIHDDMTFVGQTKSNWVYWVLPTYFAQFVCPYTLPSKKQLSSL